MDYQRVNIDVKEIRKLRFSIQQKQISVSTLKILKKCALVFEICS